MIKLFSAGFLILSVLQAGTAQTVPTCSKLFMDSGVVSGGVNITSFNDSIYFSFTVQDESFSGFQYVDFVKTNSGGAEDKRLTIKYPGWAYSTGGAGSLHITSDGYLVDGGNSGPFQVIGLGTFFKLDRFLLDTLYIKYYNINGNSSDFFVFGELSDSNYLFSGCTGDSNVLNDSAWIVVTDTGGNVLWEKTMASDFYNSAGFNYPFRGGFYQYWGTTVEGPGTGNPSDSAVFVDRYDNAGNLQWRDTFGHVGYYNYPGSFTGLREGGGIVIVVVYDTNMTEQGPTVVYKFDSTGAIVWQRYNPANGEGMDAYSMIESRSGDIVICGLGYGSSVLDTPPHGGACIYKLDGNGNLIFKQIYEYDTTRLDELDDITEMDDGGYACIGEAFEAIGATNYARTWLLKVDSNGCLNGDCPTLYSGIYAVPPPVDFFVFPSPASERYTVALGGPGDIDRYRDLTFTLYDLSGRLTFSQAITQQTTPMSRGSLAEGLYIWTLSDDSGPVSQGKIAFR